MKDNYKNYIIDKKTKVFRQKKLKNNIKYNENYLTEKILTTIDLTKLRLKKVLEYIDKGLLLDFGCGHGEFVLLSTKYFQSYGYDIIKSDKLNYLNKKEIYKKFDIICFFDSLEHMNNPFKLIKKLNTKLIFISLPECHFPYNENWFMNWKHRKYGEHLWHFNKSSLEYFMKLADYKLIEYCNFEDKIRKPYNKDLTNILTGVFKKTEEVNA